MLSYGVGVTLGVDSAAGVGVGLPVAASGVDWVSFGTAVPDCFRGQAIKSTGKSTQERSAVQMLSVMGVISGPLQRTTCLPLFTSIVEQVVVIVSAVVDVVVEVSGETTSKVAVSGSTSRA